LSITATLTSLLKNGSYIVGVRKQFSTHRKEFVMTRVVKRLADMAPEEILGMTAEKLLTYQEMQDAKARFKKNGARWKSTLKLTFEQLLTYCLAGGSKPEGLGLKDSGVSGERLRQLYAKYFSKILGISSLRRLENTRTRKLQQKSLRKNSKTLLANPRLSIGFVIREAQKAGLVASVEPYKENGALDLKARQGVVILNGRRWLILTRRTLHKANEKNNYLLTSHT
jgi:hypothetical protein